jgi:hypothetical protein
MGVGITNPGCCACSGGGGGTIPYLSCSPCPEWPADLDLVWCDPTLNNGTYPNGTISYQPMPAPLVAAGFSLPNPGWYGNATFTDPFGGVCYYNVQCASGSAILVVADLGFNAFDTIYAWNTFSPSNPCSPFALTNGKPPPGYDLGTCAKLTGGGGVATHCNNGTNPDTC